MAAWTTDFELPSTESAETSWDLNQPDPQPYESMTVHPCPQIKPDDSCDKSLPPDVSRYAAGLPGSEEASQYFDAYEINEVIQLHSSGERL